MTVPHNHLLRDECSLGWQSEHLREHFRAALFDDIVPWWESHSSDWEVGGHYSCLERNGTAYAGDKYMWMQGREIWMFSHLYNCIESQPTWLVQAKYGAEFLLKHAFREDGRMYFRLSRDGKPMATSLSLYTECFAAIALCELGKAAEDSTLVERAIAMYSRITPRLGQPEDTALLGYPITARFHLHAHDMIRLTVVNVLAAATSQEQWDNDVSLCVESLLEKHWKPEFGVLLENVAPDGQPLLDLPEGRLVHPGHAIESAWMLLETAQRRNDQLLLDTAVDIIIKSLEFGWDEEYGGIRYLLNIDRTPTHPLEADMKLWWPHSEALYALLLAWSATGREDIGRWFNRVFRYTFDHFPDSKYGEWYGYLNRDGSPTWTAKANGWKGFFHLPRALLRCYQLLNQNCNRGVEANHGSPSSA